MEINKEVSKMTKKSWTWKGFGAGVIISLILALFGLFGMNDILALLSVAPFLVGVLGVAVFKTITVTDREYPILGISLLVLIGATTYLGLQLSAISEPLSVFIVAFLGYLTAFVGGIFLPVLVMGINKVTKR